MPELPEVDSYRTGLAPTMTGWKVSGGKVLWKNASNANFSNIINQKITGFDRRGKYLIINLDKSNIIIHLRMTGRIDLTKGETPKYTTVEFEFEKGNKMCLVDYRKFGKVWIVKDIESIVGHIGIEPLSIEFTSIKFISLIEYRKGTLIPL